MKWLHWTDMFSESVVFSGDWDWMLLMGTFTEEKQIIERWFCGTGPGDGIKMKLWGFGCLETKTEPWKIKDSFHNKAP